MLVSQGPIKNGLSVIQVFMSVVSGGVGVGGKRERERRRHVGRLHNVH